MDAEPSKAEQRPAQLFLELTEHATKRMSNRHVSEEEVRYCLEDPEGNYTDRKDTVYWRYLQDGRFIKVRTTTASRNPIIIVDVIVLQN